MSEKEEQSGCSKKRGIRKGLEKLENNGKRKGGSKSMKVGEKMTRE